MIAIPVGIVTVIYWPLGSLSALLTLPLGAVGYFQYRAGGWKIEGTQLSLQYRGVLKHTMFVKKNRIQSLDTKESWFQHKKSLGSLNTTVKSGDAGYTSAVLDLEKIDMKKIALWYSHKPN